VAVLKKWLEGIQPQGRIDIMKSLRSAIKGNGGVAFILSDFMDEGFLGAEEEVLKLFAYHNMKVTLLQILSKEELEIEEDKIKPESLLKEEVGIDSLDLVDIVVIVNRIFGFKIEMAGLKDIKTLNQFYDYIDSKVNHV
jgi:acyl carrier protein